VPVRGPASGRTEGTQAVGRIAGQRGSAAYPRVSAPIGDASCQAGSPQRLRSSSDAAWCDRRPWCVTAHFTAGILRIARRRAEEEQADTLFVHE
jgi:hypothetical protein